MPPARPVVAVTGLAREAALVSGAGVRTVAGGGDAAALARKLDGAAAGAVGIVSVGLAGALADDIGVGDWIVADGLAGAIESETDPRWRDHVAALLPGARIGRVYADGRMIATVADKRALGARHGALAVDMESHVAAAAARRHGLPLAIVRVVSDRVDQPLPPAFAAAMRADGTVDLAAMARALARRPGQLPRLIGGGRDGMRALAALARGARLLGPRLGCPYLGDLPLDLP